MIFPDFTIFPLSLVQQINQLHHLTRCCERKVKILAFHHVEPEPEIDRSLSDLELDICRFLSELEPETFLIRSELDPEIFLIRSELETEICRRLSVL